MRKELTVDICIPTYKPGEEFRLLLKRLSAQEYPVQRLWIANTEEKYWDTSLEKEYPRCRVIHIAKNEFDHGGTRHMLATLSDADLLLFMTQDAMPADDRMVTALAEQFDRENVKAAYARQLPRKDCGLLERYTREFNYPAKSRIKTAADLPVLGVKTFFCSNVCAMYDRKTYLELGGFPKKTIFNEDMIYAGGLIQAGYAIAYAAEARVIHSHNYSNSMQFHRNFDLAVSQAQYPELFDAYPSEGEGMKLVKNTAAYVCRKGKPYLVFSLGIKSICKYAGYFLGKRYKKLSASMIRRCTMNPGFWE